MAGGVQSAGEAPLHLVSAFASTSRLVPGQEAVPDKANELTAIPALLARLGEQDGSRGAVVSIDAIATNAAIATAIPAVGADDPLALKANQPTLPADIEACFKDASLETIASHIERREVSVIREVDWLSGDRRFPGELRLASVACLVKVDAEVGRGGQTHSETRYDISSAALDADRAAQAVRGHWGVENRLHWVLDVTFKEDQSRLRKGFGARTLAVVRHFALNLVRIVADGQSLTRSRKHAAWATDYLNQLLTAPIS